MRVYAMFVVVVASVAAKGSGPYLPSGWRPEGPAFYLPSEIQKLIEIPIKEAVIQESEASGSDSFQEYGPPKIQEVSQDLSNQGLPDADIEQTFAAVYLKVEQNEEKEVAVTESQAVTEEVEGKVNQKSISEEIVPVTETLVLVESTTLIAESDIITEFQPEVEVTTQVTDESSANVINTETEITQEEDASLGTEQQELVNQLQQKSVELTQQENENANSEIGTTFEQRVQQEEIPVTETFVLVESTTLIAESDVITEFQPAVEVKTQVTDESSANIINTETKITQEEDASPGTEQQELVNQLQQKSVELTQQENENANSEIVTTFEQKVQQEEIQTVAKEVEKVETEVKQVETEVEKVETQVQNVESEFKAVDQEVQNIPELLINLDNEIKKQQAENIQVIANTKVTLETFGSLEQAPEGFLEYGPPGFKEYGPPKDELRSTAEEIKPELQSIEINETRKRRFSPKFRITRKASKQ